LHGVSAASLGFLSAQREGLPHPACITHTGGSKHRGGLWKRDPSALTVKRTAALRFVTDFSQPLSLSERLYFPGQLSQSSKQLYEP
ncbi:hypothetical protein D4Z76_09215, partial [Campylobacter coli]